MFSEVKARHVEGNIFEFTAVEAAQFRMYDSDSDSWRGTVARCTTHEDGAGIGPLIPHVAAGVALSPWRVPPPLDLPLWSPDGHALLAISGSLLVGPRQ